MDNNGAAQFRRATGKVAMVGGNASTGYQQGYYQPPMQQQQQQQQQYPGTYQQHANRGDNYSAMAVPYNPRMPAQAPPQAGYYHTIAPAHIQQQQQQQQQQQPRQDSASAQSYYQQAISGTAHPGYAHSGSGDMIGMHGNRKQPHHQPASLDSQHQPMADSAVHSNAYIGQPNHGDEAAMANSFQQMGIGARHTPLAPRQHLSAEAQRKREQALENAYDDDDGYAGNDIDVTLFPSTASQVVSTMRAGSAASSRPTSSRNAGKSLEKSISSPLLDSQSMRIKKCTSLYDSATGARIAAGSAQPLEPLQLPVRQTNRGLWAGVSRSNTSATSSTVAATSGDKPRRIQRRQSSDTGASIIHRIDRRHSYVHLNTLASPPKLSPLPPHWRRCCRTHSTTTGRRHMSTIPESPFPVARPYANAPSGARPPTSRNVSGHAPPMPADIAANQRFNGSAGSSGPSTNTNSPALGARPYAQGSGFDSSSDHLYPNARNLPPPQQHLKQGVPAHVSSPLVEPSAPPLQYGEHQQMQGQGNLNALYGAGRVYGAAAMANSNYSHSSNGDGMTLNDPPLQPPSNMRPWTASSRSLPLAAPSPQFAERERPSSSASSGNGLPPMGAHPLANAAPANPPKAPAPTLASLEAYRTSIKRSNDPAAQLDFAKYILEHARGIADNEPNPKLVKKRYELLTEEGLKWVRKLAGSGITVHRSNIAAEAQYFLGTVYSRGIYNVQRDDGKAFSYYQQASKAQHAEANYRTAVCYEVGVGTRRDPSRALQFYRKAAAQSNVPAMYKLGVILIKGLLGVSPSPREGINWLKRGADNATPECPHALHELALCHESSEIPGVIPDETYARQLYIKAGKLGYVPSQVRLGQAYEYGSLGCPIDPRRSIGWYTRAAEKNDGDAELALSGWYLTGAEPHLPQNDVEAFLWARRAADHGSAKAMYAVGYYYECGIGVAHPDVNEAHKWYTMAAKKQNRRAMARLQELKQMGVNVVPLSKAPRPKRGKGSIF